MKKGKKEKMKNGVYLLIDWLGGNQNENKN